MVTSSRIFFAVYGLSLLSGCGKNNGLPIGAAIEGGTYKVFVTGGTTTGNALNAAAIDNYCANNATSAGYTGTYKAMLPVGTRRACTTPNCTSASENVDWVFKPNSFYIRASDNAPLFKTNSAGIFDFTSGNMQNGWSTTNADFWTGMDVDWTSTPGLNCNNFTSSSAAVNGFRGRLNGITNLAINTSPDNCGVPYPVVCVEQ